MNGDRSKFDTPYVPITINEYLEEIEWFISKGINVFHIHFRDLTGNESLEQLIIEPQFMHLKKIFPSCKIGIGTPLQHGMTSEKREQLISQWTWSPDFVSLNLSEEGSIELSKILNSKQIPIEYGIFSMLDALTFEKFDLQKNAYRVLIEIFDMDTAEEAVKAAHELVLFFQKRFSDIEFGVAWRKLLYMGNH